MFQTIPIPIVNTKRSNKLKELELQKKNKINPRNWNNSTKIHRDDLTLLEYDEIILKESKKTHILSQPICPICPTNIQLHSYEIPLKSIRQRHRKNPIVLDNLLQKSWNNQTKLYDDPERLKPNKRYLGKGKDQKSFLKTFHHEDRIINLKKDDNIIKEISISEIN